METAALVVRNKCTHVATLVKDKHLIRDVC